MSFTSKLLQVYFNYAYNPVYDFTTAELNRYQKLQAKCVGKLELRDGDRVLCVGMGTGNEVLHILKVNRRVDIVGADCSSTALRKAYAKARRMGKEIRVLTMDARRLQFDAESFDRILCVHVMDFVEDQAEVTRELFRVLKVGGQFVVTYPSNREGPRLGLNLLTDSLRHSPNLGHRSILAFLRLMARMLVGVVYFPLLFRPNRKSYSRSELRGMIEQFFPRHFDVEEDLVYQDFIVYGRK